LLLEKWYAILSLLKIVRTAEVKLWLRKVKCPAIKLLVLIGRVRRRWSKLARGVRRSLSISELRDMGITIPLRHANLLRQDISVALLSLSLPLGTGRVKNFGQARVVLLSPALKPRRENISIFVKTNYYAYSKLQVRR
jgi:hypothetical protein